MFQPNKQELPRIEKIDNDKYFLPVVVKNKEKINQIIRAGKISRASFSTVDAQGMIISDHEHTQNLIFQCASLSKPVFAYLILKLIKLNEIKSADAIWAGKFKCAFNLDTPLYTVFGDSIHDDNNHFLKKFSTGKRQSDGLSYQQEAKQLTARMVLSHTTGLPIVGKEPFELQFAPGTHYNYSGPGIECLQEVIEALTLPSLEVLANSKERFRTSDIKQTCIETLAQEHIFGENALKMPNSSFGDKPSGANSLKTTTEEYAKFIQAWIKDDQLNYAFEPVKPADSMMNDFFPNPNAVKRLVKEIQVDDANRKLVAWGLGVGLVKNTKEKIIGIYHTGDMGNPITSWRAGFGATINPETGACTGLSVYLTESTNGHMLADLVLPSELKPALDYFFPTYGFARNIAELHHTNFLGLNPSILIKELQEDAGYNIPTSELKQDSDPMQISMNKENSTGKMLHQMNMHTAAFKPECPIEKSDLNNQFETILIKAFQNAVPIAVAKQQPIIEAVNEKRIPGEAEGVRKKPDGSNVTPGDIESQKVFIQTMVNEFALSNQKIFAIAEEEGLENVLDLVDEAKADFRVIVDPIDSTGNFSKGFHSNLTESESGYGWGSMIAIQKRNASNQWVTIAAGIYESSMLDSIDRLHGKIYLATEEFKGIKIFSFANNAIEYLKPRQAELKKYVGGKFIDKSISPAFEKQMQILNKEKMDLSCVAQSALAVINGHADTYFQGNPFIHDVAPIAYLAQAAGLQVYILPEVSRTSDSTNKDAYPFIIATDDATAQQLVTIYCQNMGYNFDNLIVRKGNMEVHPYNKIHSNLIQKTHSTLSQELSSHRFSLFYKEGTSKKQILENTHSDSLTSLS